MSRLVLVLETQSSAAPTDLGAGVMPLEENVGYSPTHGGTLQTEERAREAALRAASRSLSDFLDNDPAAVELVASSGALPDRSDYVAEIRGACSEDGASGLRLQRRRRFAEIAARDVSGELSLEQVGLALSDLADASLEAALALVGAPDGLAIVGMGKLGGRELNYASDIDLMFVTDGEIEPAVEGAEALLRVLSDFSPEGQAYRIDLDLRPEGRSGALVRSVDGCLEYYRRWAQSWEFQALIKARHAAGHSNAATALIEGVRELVYPAAVTPERVASIRAMKEKVESHTLRTARRGRHPETDDVKLGPGGIRDIEFSIQLLQLVHGGSDPSVRSPSTNDALRALVDGGYVAEDDGAGLAVAYRWLRTVEHRLQLWQERQVHSLPGDEGSRARLARVLGFKDSPAESARERFERTHARVQTDVRERFEKLFYRPMIESLADGGAQRLSPDALKDRLRAFGFRDVDRAARTIGDLVSGTSRRARLFRVLTPALLRFLASTPRPDEGLFSFLQLGEALGGHVDVLGAFRDNPPGLWLLAQVLGSGKVLGDVLAHVPEQLSVMAERTAEADRPLALKSRERLVREAFASLDWREPERRLDGLRRFKRRSMLEVALEDVVGIADPSDVGVGLSDVADACLEAALRNVDEPFAVIGMGKLGGRELNYSSDIDVMFVHDCAPEKAEKLAEDLMRAIGEVTPEGQAFRIDARLRPEGQTGPLARSLRSFLEYYERWAEPWERMALIKARASAGDASVAEDLVMSTRRFAFRDEFPQGWVAEIRHLKARMERERIPRGADPRRHLKLGPGGTSDIEFAAQLMQLEHGYGLIELRAAGTLDVLRAASSANLLPSEDARQLDHAYRFLARLRNRLFLMVGRPTDLLPTKAEDLEAVGIAMGFKDQPRQEIEEEYLRVTRITRRIAEPLIYGERV